MQMRVFVLLDGAAGAASELGLSLRGCAGGAAEEEGKMREPGWSGASQARTLAAQDAMWAGLAGHGPTELRSSLERSVGCTVGGQTRGVGVVVSEFVGDEEAEHDNGEGG